MTGAYSAEESELNRADDDIIINANAQHERVIVFMLFFFNIKLTKSLKIASAAAILKKVNYSAVLQMTA